MSSSQLIQSKVLVQEAQQQNVQPSTLGCTKPAVHLCLPTAMTSN